MPHSKEHSPLGTYGHQFPRGVIAHGPTGTSEFREKNLPFSGGGGNSYYSVYTGGSGPHGRPEVASGRGMPPGSAMLWAGNEAATASVQ
jgi:hypothetical protein